VAFNKARYIVICFAVCAAGALLGHAFRRITRHSSGFDTSDWPSRGSGESLVEYFDPQCAISLQVHRELDTLFSASKRKFRQTTVLVEMSPDDPRHWAYALCSASDADVWTLSSELARGDFSRIARSPSVNAGHCAQRIRSATQHLADIQGKLATPFIEFRGTFYAGYDGFLKLRSVLQ
jgi:hypothetical protein